MLLFFFNCFWNFYYIPKFGVFLKPKPLEPWELAELEDEDGEINNEPPENYKLHLKFIRVAWAIGIWGKDLQGIELFSSCSFIWNLVSFLC